MLGGLGIEKILLIGLVCLMLFGAKRLPEIGASFGKGIREFKGSLSQEGGARLTTADDVRPIAPERSASVERQAEVAGQHVRDTRPEPRRLIS